MARFVILNFPAGRFGLVAGGLGLMACFSASLRAQQPMTPAAAAQATPAPAKTPAIHPPPVLPPDTFSQYGKIVAPSDQMAHPLKLKLPFPGVGEVKVPTKDELTMREKLEQLAMLSDADIRVQLEKWPAFSKMSLRDEGAMLQRIQDFRDYRANVAKVKAHNMGLLTLLPDQQARFEKEYWDKQLQMDRDLARQFEPIFKAREQKLEDELYREFSSASAGPVAQVPKPPPASATKPPQAPPSVTQNKAEALPTNSVDPASLQPMAQAPH
jgi:hypothetical protein